MAERKQKVSIPLTVLSVLIAVIVVFPIVWMVLSSFKPSGELFSFIRCTCFPRTPRSSITPLCWRAASWVM